MHIEPGIVDGAKIALSYVTAIAAGSVAAKAAVTAASEKGAVSVLLRGLIATVAVFVFFEILPNYPIGVAEVHFILGSTLFLTLGVGPAAIGLSLGLLAQGIFFEPADLPQYGMNVTTLLVPLLAVDALARRIILPGTAYVDLEYRQALALSTAYQGGVVAWVAFWAIYGRGLGAENLASIATFGVAYMTVVIIEPLADLAVLAVAKTWRGKRPSILLTPRLYAAG